MKFHLLISALTIVALAEATGLPSVAFANNSAVPTMTSVEARSASAQAVALKAFPEAQGWGRFATGGRGGTVYHVTNLNDAGAGSLRDAVSRPNRIIVFDVAGVINIKSRIAFAPNLYIAGQTAPGEGVTVYGDGMSFTGASNIICRYMRFRMGHVGTEDQDAATLSSGRNMIFDHVSVSWGRDETFSINNNFNPNDSITDITLQNCIIGQGLMGHSAGGLIQGYRITQYRNLYVDNNTRNTKVKGINQYVNCMVYNWNDGGYLMGGNSATDAYAHLQHNLFINGPAGVRNAITDGNARFHLFAEDNWQDRDRDGRLNPYEITDEEYVGGPDFQDEPFDFPELPVWQAVQLPDSLLPTVGASLPYRDYADCYMVGEVLSYGQRGTFISDEAVLPYGVPTTWKLYTGQSRIDTDGDGMPDEWELEHDTDADRDDAMTVAANGYTNIENYINSIGRSSRDNFVRRPFCLTLQASTDTTLLIGWLDFSDNETAFCIEMRQPDGTWSEIGRTRPDATTWSVGGLSPQTDYSFRIRTESDGAYSDYCEPLTATTRKQHVAMTDCDTFRADCTWEGGSGAWNTTEDRWTGGLYRDGASVAIAPAFAAEIELTETVQPSTVVVRGDRDVTLTGRGVLTGATTVNKTGASTFTPGSDHSYTGATLLHGGTVTLSALSNGGLPSSIGASSPAAENWIWDGGCWRYTGASTETDRSAILYAPTNLDLATAGRTLTMTGHIEGDGNLILCGSGQLRIGSSDFFQYTGATTLAGGELVFGTYDISRVGIGSSSRLILAGGTLTAQDGSASNYQQLTFPIEVAEGTYSYIHPGGSCYMAGAVSGSGTVEVVFPYIREYFTGDWTDFTGHVVATGTYKSGTDLSICGIYNAGGIPNGTLELKGGIRVMDWEVNGELYIGGLSGPTGTFLSGSTKNNANATMIWHVGSANTDETFSGIIDNRCYQSTKNCHVSIVKEGFGLWRLTGNNVYNGATQIKAGTLCVNGRHTGTGAISVQADATLCGTGSLAAPVSVASGGILSAGDTIVGSTLTLSGGCTLRDGAILALAISSDATNPCNSLTIAGATTMGSDCVLRLDMTQVTDTIAPNSYFPLINLKAGGSLQGVFARIEPAKPADGLEWDASQLLQIGRLYVRAASTAIDKLTPDRTDSDDIMLYYDLAGHAVSRDFETLPAGIYLRRVVGVAGQSSWSKIAK